VQAVVEGAVRRRIPFRRQEEQTEEVPKRRVAQAVVTKEGMFAVLRYDGKVFET
jgi:hypothetical protein